MATWPYNGEWPRIRQEVLERDGHQCQIRGPKCQDEATDVDHIISWRLGGAGQDKANLRAACWPCNRGKHQNYVKALEAALATPRGEVKASRTW